MPARYGCLRIIILITTDLIVFSRFSSLNRFLSVSKVDFRVKSAIVFEHSIDDSEDFMHAQAYGSHFFHPLPDMFLIDPTDQGVFSNGRHRDHE